MRTRWLAGRGLRALLAAPLVLAAALAGSGPGAASASAGRHWTWVHTPSPATANPLQAVTVVSPHRAWAVGSYGKNPGPGASTLIEQWDGSSWKRQASPTPGGRYGQAYLSSVAATSARNAWAAGWWANGQGSNTLILHWDGTTWTRVPSPNPEPGDHSNELLGVTATSPDNAWAVGASYYIGHYPPEPDKTLIEHWDGTAWTRVPSPNLGLFAVAATSPTDAWAVGGGIEHWDGTAWTVVPSSNPGGRDRAYYLYAVTATSPVDAWAAGQSCNEVSPGPVCHTLILHWDGTTWARVPSPNPGSAYSQLHGVTASSPTSAWAVGDYASTRQGPDHTLILHWNGTTWARVPSPNPSPNINELYAVSAASATDIWAVGWWAHDPFQRTLALHCC